MFKKRHLRPRCLSEAKVKQLAACPTRLVLLTSRGVTRLDGARAKKQIWRPHVQTWDPSEANVLCWRKCMWHCWDFSAPGELRPPWPSLVTPLLTSFHSGLTVIPHKQSIKLYSKLLGILLRPLRPRFLKRPGKTVANTTPVTRFHHGSQPFPSVYSTDAFDNCVLTPSSSLSETGVLGQQHNSQPCWVSNLFWFFKCRRAGFSFEGKDPSFPLLKSPGWIKPIIHLRHKRNRRWRNLDKRTTAPIHRFVF